MSVMRVTAGPWTLAERSTSYIMGGDGRAVCSVWADGGLLRQKGDAALIAEAGTVYNETGRTPRQLADDVARLLAALAECLGYIEMTMAHTGNMSVAQIVERLRRDVPSVSSVETSHYLGCGVTTRRVDLNAARAALAATKEARHA